MQNITVPVPISEKISARKQTLHFEIHDLEYVVVKVKQQISPELTAVVKVGDKISQSEHPQLQRYDPENKRSDCDSCYLSCQNQKVGQAHPSQIFAYSNEGGYEISATHSCKDIVQKGNLLSS